MYRCRSTQMHNTALADPRGPPPDGLCHFLYSCSSHLCSLMSAYVIEYTRTRRARPPMALIPPRPSWYFSSHFSSYACFRAFPVQSYVTRSTDRPPPPLFSPSPSSSTPLPPTLLHLSLPHSLPPSPTHISRQRPVFRTGRGGCGRGSGGTCSRACCGSTCSARRLARSNRT